MARGTFSSPLQEGQENHIWLARRIADSGGKVWEDSGILFKY